MGTRVELQRMTFLIRKMVAKELVLNDTNFVVEELASSFAFYMRAHIYGKCKRVEVCAGPDGWWQMLRCLLRRPYRSKYVTVDVMALFPELIGTEHTLSLEVYDDSGTVVGFDRVGGEAGQDGRNPEVHL